MAVGNPKVLIVDDDPDFVEVSRIVLTKHGFEVLTAANGRQALAAMKQEPPDVVILDVMMDGATEGYHITHMMREDPALSRIPVLMVSSIMDSPYADQFPTDEYLPADGFLRKPVNPEQLVREVRALLRR